MWIIIGLFGYLTVLAICDVRTKKIPMVWLKIGYIVAAAYVVWQGINQPFDTFWPELIKSLGPGMLLLAAGRVSGKIGEGDGCVLLVVGSILGSKKTLLVFSGALFLAALTGTILLVLGKAGKDSKIPFIPFLVLALMLAEVMR